MTAFQNTEPVPPPAEPEEEATGPCSDLSSHELERLAIEMLDRGESSQAREQLECALELNPDSLRAKSLIEQLDADPVSYLGSRSYPYLVQSNETLSKIAQERLGSSLKFVILARYNEIEIPANLVAGRTIRIPGEEPIKQPAEEQPPGHSGDAAAEPLDAEEEFAPETDAEAIPASVLVEEALRKETQGDLQGAYDLINKAHSIDPSAQGLGQDLFRIRSALIGQLEEQAYSQELSGALKEAIATWSRVLEIDPSNIPGQLSTKRLEAQLQPAP